MLDNSLIGKEAIYWKEGQIYKVKATAFKQSAEQVEIRFAPVGRKSAQDTKDEQLEYFERDFELTAFNLTAKPNNYRFSNQIFSVLDGAKVNFNEFAIKHFDENLTDFEIIWYDFPKS